MLVLVGDPDFALVDLLYPLLEVVVADVVLDLVRQDPELVLQNVLHQVRHEMLTLGLQDSSLLLVGVRLLVTFYERSRFAHLLPALL